MVFWGGVANVGGGGSTAVLQVASQPFSGTPAVTNSRWYLGRPHDHRPGLVIAILSILTVHSVLQRRAGQNMTDAEGFAARIPY